MAKERALKIHETRLINYYCLVAFSLGPYGGAIRARARACFNILATNFGSIRSSLQALIRRVTMCACGYFRFPDLVSGWVYVAVFFCNKNLHVCIWKFLEVRSGLADRIDFKAFVRIAVFHQL